MSYKKISKRGLVEKMAKIGCLFLTLGFWANALATQAAEIKIFPDSAEFYPGQTVKVDFSLDNPAESINALKGNIAYPRDILELQGVEDGGSIINLWIEKPQISSGMDLNFAGVSAGGFKGTAGFIFTLTFKVKENELGRDQNGLISVRNAEFFLNDGSGTKTNVFSADVSFLQKNENLIKPSDVAEVYGDDHEPPSVFSPYITKNPDILNNRWAMLFLAQDKGSGIDHYEIHETKEKYAPPEMEKKKLTWITVESPYLLQDQNLKNYVYVRAVDRAGNKRTATVFPRKYRESAGYGSKAFFGIMILVLGLLTSLFLRKSKK